MSSPRCRTFFAAMCIRLCNESMACHSKSKSHAWVPSLRAAGPVSCAVGLSGAQPPCFPGPSSFLTDPVSVTDPTILPQSQWWILLRLSLSVTCYKVKPNICSKVEILESMGEAKLTQQGMRKKKYNLVYCIKQNPFQMNFLKEEQWHWIDLVRYMHFSTRANIKLQGEEENNQLNYNGWK